MIVMGNEMKTAQETLVDHGFDLDLFSEENEYSAKNLVNAMKDYASIQIKKDRELVKSAINEHLKDCGGLACCCSVYFETTPIILD